MKNGSYDVARYFSGLTRARINGQELKTIGDLRILRERFGTLILSHKECSLEYEDEVLEF